MKPYAKAQTISLVGMQDRRRKLTDKQRQEILRIRRESGLGYRPLARMFGVSRSLVRIVCDREYAERIRERTKANWRKYHQRYGKAAHAASVRRTRNYKYKLYLGGQLAEADANPKEEQCTNTQ